MKMFLIIVTVLGIAVLLLVFGLTAYPAPYTDSIIYLPAAINLAQGKGLINQACTMAHLIDQTGADRFIYNVPLFPLVLGLLMWKATPQNAFLVIALINTLSLILSAHLFYRTAGWNSRKITVWEPLLISVSLVGLSTLFTGHYGGRPEILATLIFVATLSLCLYWPSKNLWFPLSLGLGLTGATLPGSALVFAAFIATFFASTQRPLKAIRSVFDAAIFSIAIFLLALGAGPFPIADTLAGSFRHFSSIRESLPPKMNWPDYFSYANMMFLMIPLALSFIFSVAFFWVYRKAHASSFLVGLFGIVFWGLVFLFTIPLRRMTHILPFMPLFFVITLAGIFCFKSRLLKIGLALLLGMTTTGFVRTSALFPFYLKKGVRLETARGLLESFLRTQDPSIKLGISDSLWVLSEDYSRMMMCQSYRIGCEPENGKMLLLWQQAGTAWTEPPQTLKGLPLSQSFFSPEVPRLFGMKLAHTMPGYGYAIYLKQDEH